jgi:homoserine O-succinyltransferase
MPLAARKSTRRQFFEIISAAAQAPVTIRWFAMAACDGYEPIERLWESKLDGLIVTGNEPHGDLLTNEPHWPQLVETVEWAKYHTTSAIWSCLAAHAAAFRLDGIERRALPKKISGVFTSEKTAGHPLSRDLQAVWQVPHSRCNDLTERDLTSCGYRILSRSAVAGVDMAFKRIRGSAFLLIQSHPEYDARALLREYRRDVIRFIANQRESYPDIPHGYFSEALIWSLESLRLDALRNRHTDWSPRLRILDLAEVQCSWKPTAVQLYRSWTGLLAAEQARMAVQVAL